MAPSAVLHSGGGDGTQQLTAGFAGSTTSRNKTGAGARSDHMTVYTNAFPRPLEGAGKNESDKIRPKVAAQRRQSLANGDQGR